LRIVLHRDIPEDPDLQCQWNALVYQMERPEVFYTHQWAKAVQCAYHSSLVPFLVLAYEADVLIGVVALATDPGHQTASFLAGTTADYCEFLSHPSHREPLAQAAFSELRKARIKKMELANLPADSATPRAIRSAATKHGYRVFLRPAYLCAQVQLGSGESREDLKKGLLHKKMFRRNISALGKQGLVALGHLRSWDEIEEVLPKYSAAHVARFLATGRISNLSKADRRLFLHELARSLSAAGWMTLTRLMVGEQPIAWNYGFQFGGSWFWYQPTFDSKEEQYSPGYCLLTKIITEACDAREMAIVDLGLGAEGYKERVANSALATLHGTVTTSLGPHLGAFARYRLAQAVRLSPRLESGIRTGLRRFDSVRRRVRQAGAMGFLGWGTHRLSALVSSRREVFFYQWSTDSRTAGGNARASPVRLTPLSLEILATAAMQFEGETETYDYLLRAAHRLRADEGQGFALLDEKGVPVHFCWVSAFEGFYMDELKIRLSSPGPNATLIFDCWTPGPVRGRGYYGVAVALTAKELELEGRVPWIFSAVSNRPSVRGLEKAGFQRCYSMIRQRTLMIQRVTKLPLASHQDMEAPVGP
jgi:CelD/BcsL family acetyltransferase involved in cellulose biosynthesis